MFQEPSKEEWLPFLILNIFASLLQAAAHNHLYFLLNLTTFQFHFLHYFAIFVVLSLMHLRCRSPNDPKITLKDVLPISLTQLGISFATGTIHSSGNDGALYTIRFTDFVVTLLVLAFAKKILSNPATLPNENKRFLLIVMAVSSSLAWLEFTIFDYSLFSVLAIPLLAISTAIHFLITFEKYQTLGASFNQLLLYTAGLTSLFLLPQALLFTSDSFNSEMVGIAGAWDFVDYFLLVMCACAMTGTVYSQYWLVTHFAPETYVASMHFKHTLAAISQWFAHNMEHATLHSGVARIVAVAALGAYGHKRYKEAKGMAEEFNFKNEKITLSVA